MPNKNIYLSYFCGAGGSAIAARDRGYEVIGVDSNAAASEIFRRNIGSVFVLDVREMSQKRLRGIISCPEIRKKLGVKLYWQISPPCQESSRLNQNADLYSSRGRVLEDISSHLAWLRPDAIWLECVEGFRGTSPYKNFLSLLKSSNYIVKDGIYSSCDFGVPQIRKRLIMRAVDVDGGLALSRVKKRPSSVGWWDVLEDIIQGMPDSELTEAQKEVLREKGIQINLGTKFLIERVGYFHHPKVFQGNSLAPTVKATLADDGRNGTRTKWIDCVFNIDGKIQIKNLTPMALARLQTFPDDFVWLEETLGFKENVRAIGNSVPCKLAESILESFKAKPLLPN